MDNETNQVESIEEVNMDLGLEGLEDFDSFENLPEEPNEVEETEEVEESKEDNDPTEEESEEKDTEEEETADSEKVKPKLSELLGFEDYKHNHEEGKVDDISIEDAKRFFQKGMNEEYVDKRSREQNNDFKEIAEMFGLDITSLTETLKQQYFEDKAKKESRNVNDVKTEYESNRKGMVAKMTDRFIDKYPDIAVDKLPKEVMDATAEGKDLIDAYESYNKDVDIQAKTDEIKTLKERIATLEKGEAVKKQNAKIKKKGIVKSAEGNDSEQHDDFLSGLFGDD